MKADRFVKVMLVVIAGLLFLNCVKDSGSGGISVPFLETKVKATVPALIQVGKSVNCSLDNGYNGETIGLQILGIDKDSGWIKAEVSHMREGKLTEWVNSAYLISCQEMR